MVFGTRPLLKLARSLGACVLLLAAAMPAEAASIRLAWDPNPEPEVVGYLVYVGTTPGSYTQTFDVGNQTVFVYPYAVPGGTYYFAVAAYTAGWHVGARSVEVSAIVPGAPPAPPPGPGAPGDGSRRVVCLDSRTSGCYAIQHVASGLGEISSASRSPDGRLFFIENGDRVRLLAGDTLVAEPAVLEQSGARLGTVVVDPAFDVTGFVFVSRVVTLADGSRTLDVVRYRAVQGQLGEAATVLPGLPLPPDGDAPFAIDANGRIYVAIPAGADVYGGYVVRFEQDGTVPRDGVSSPIFAHGYPRPHALQWDAVHEQLWATGTDPNASHTLARIDLNPVGAVEWPRSAAPIEVQSTWLRETLRVGPLALSGAPAPEMTHTAFLVRESGELYRAGLPAAGPRAVATLVETRLPGGAVAVAAGSGDDAYFVLRSGPAQWSLFAMQRVPDR